MRSSLIIASCLLMVVNGYSQQSRVKKNTVWGITASLPYLNNYSFYDHHAARQSGKSGFAGFGLGLFYQKEKDKISLNSGATADLFAPIGPIDYGKTGQRIAIGSYFGELIWHHTIIPPRISVIGGISMMQYRYRFYDYDNSIFQSNYDNTWGITAGTEYRFTKTFSIAAFYRPALFTKAASSYRHLLSIDFRFDISVIGRKDNDYSQFRRRSPQKRGGNRVIWRGRRHVSQRAY